MYSHSYLLTGSGDQEGYVPLPFITGYAVKIGPGNSVVDNCHLVDVDKTLLT